MVDGQRSRGMTLARFTGVGAAAVLLGMVVAWAAWPRDDAVSPTEEVPTVAGTSPELSVVTTAPPPTTRPPSTTSTSTTTSSSTTTSTRPPRPNQDDDSGRNGRDSRGRDRGSDADDD